MADTIGPLRVLSTWKAAENARHFRLFEVARHLLVGLSSVGVLNRAGEAVDLGPDHRRNYGMYVMYHVYTRPNVQIQRYIEYYCNVWGYCWRHQCIELNTRAAVRIYG